MRLILTLLLILIGSPIQAQSLLSGNTSGNAPVSSVGSEGQWFLDNSSGKIFGPKSFGAWPSSPVSTAAAWLATQSGVVAPAGAWTFLNPLSVASALPTISACGTTPPAAAAGSNNNAGQFTLGTDTPTACTVTFAAPFTTAAFCTVSPASANGAAISGGYYISAQSAAAFTLTIGTGTNSLVWNYTCMGN